MNAFASWLAVRSKRELSDSEAHALASLSLGALISTRLLRGAYSRAVAIDDEQLVDAWVRLLTPTLEV